MIVVASVVSAVACFLILPPRVRHRPSPRLSHRRRMNLGEPRTIRLVSAACGATFAFVWGGWMGVVLGLALAVGSPIVIGRLESRSARARREALESQAAVCADLLASCLLSGAPLALAARAVGEAVGAPAAERLKALVGALELGSDPVVAWHAFGADPALEPIARAAARSVQTGAPLASLLVGTADDLRRAERSRGEAAARAAGVRAVGPLAACFLPSFILLGVVPVVASMAAPLLGSWS